MIKESGKSSTERCTFKYVNSAVQVLYCLNTYAETRVSKILYVLFDNSFLFFVKLLYMQKSLITPDNRGP